MRKSVKKDDPGYDPLATHYSPFLDGGYVFNCFTADEELGEVWIYELDEKGQYRIDEEENLKIKCLKGKVEIKLKEEI